MRFNGWYEVNRINASWFGLIVKKSKKYGNLSYICTHVNGKLFGWFVSYNHDGSINNDYSGLFLMGDRI